MPCTHNACVCLVICYLVSSLVKKINLVSEMSSRVLIRCHCARRDAAPMILYQKLLDHMGANAVLSSMRSFETYIKYWHPHAIVVGTFGKVLETKKIAPSSKIIVFDMEGYQMPGHSRAEYLKENQEIFDACDQIFLWGPASLSEFDQFAKNLDQSKCHVVGNPKLDLVRFLPSRFRKKKKKNSVGFITRFPPLNHHEGRQIIQKAHLRHFQDNLQNQIKSFTAIMKIIERLLLETDCAISLRPHPNEQIEGYRENLVRWFGDEAARIDVDDSLFFPTWAAGQDFLISPSSTSFLEAYLLKVPVFNIDKISGNYSENKESSPFVASWQEGALLPLTVDQLVATILENDVEVLPEQDIDKQIDDYGNWASKKSATFLAASRTVDFLNSQRLPVSLYIPQMLLNLWDDYKFRSATKLNPLHHNFNFSRSFHDIPLYVDEMVSKIINSNSNA